MGDRNVLCPDRGRGGGCYRDIQICLLLIQLYVLNRCILLLVNETSIFFFKKQSTNKTTSNQIEDPRRDGLSPFHSVYGNTGNTRKY